MIIIVFLSVYFIEVHTLYLVSDCTSDLILGFTYACHLWIFGACYCEMPL